MPGHRPARRRDLRHRRVPNARPVEVERQTRAACHLRDRDDVVERKHAPATSIVRVLHADEACPGEVMVSGADRGTDLVGAEQPLVADQCELDTRKSGRRSRLVQVAVARGPGDDRVSRLGVAPDRHLVRHRAGRHEQRRLLAQSLRGEILQAVDGRILVVDVVSHLGTRYRLAHPGGGSSYGVAAKVDRRHRLMRVYAPVGAALRTGAGG